MEIHLLKFPTGCEHPDAQQPRILVAENLPGVTRYLTEMEIIGEYMSVMFDIHESLSSEMGQLRVYEWKTGNLAAVSLC